MGGQGYRRPMAMHGDRGGQYFDPAPGGALAAVARVRAAPCPTSTSTLATDRGVFAGDGVDPGTKLLLLEAPRPTPAPAAPARPRLRLRARSRSTLARRAPAATVWAVDVNERARALCAANAERRRARRTCASSPPTTCPTDVRFDGIWSNPPIRIGKAALHELLERWLGRLAAGRRRLARRAQAPRVRLAARWLAADRSRRPTRLASRAGYRILEVGLSERSERPREAARRHRAQAPPPRVAPRDRRTRRPAARRRASTYNVGSILRTAAAERVEHLWFTGDRHAARPPPASARPRSAPSAT